MPLAQVSMLEGRTEEQKTALIAAVTEAIMESVGAPRESVRVVIYEVAKTNWGIGGKSAKALGR
jgi:4-oxalocrotonate tautomerase